MACVPIHQCGYGGIRLRYHRVCTGLSEACQLQNIPVTCEKRLKIVKERQQDIQEEIDTAFKILQEELESKKKQLLRAASNLSQKQLQMLKLHSEKAQQHYKLLAAFYEIASEQMTDEVSQKPVIVYRECAQKLDQILATFLPKDKTLPVELKVNLALWQAQSRENKDAFSKYVGQVILRPSAQSKDMSIEGKGAERAIAGLPTHFKVILCTHSCTEQGHAVSNGKGAERVHTQVYRAAFQSCNSSWSRPRENHSRCSLMTSSAVWNRRMVR